MDPIMGCRTPAYTKILVVTLPETTPVLEASVLEDNLQRWHPAWAWVMNQSLAAASTVAAAPSQEEQGHIDSGAATRHPASHPPPATRGTHRPYPLG